MEVFIEKLKALDESVQQKFLERLHKLKTLKRVMPASKSAFIRDASGILGDEHAELIPLLEEFYENVSYEDFASALTGAPVAAPVANHSAEDEESHQEHEEKAAHEETAAPEEAAPAPEPEPEPVAEQQQEQEMAEAEAEAPQAEHTEQAHEPEPMAEHTEMAAEDAEAAAAAVEAQPEEAQPEPMEAEEQQPAEAAHDAAPTEAPAAETAPAQEQARATQTTQPAAATTSDTVTKYGGEPRVHVEPEGGSSQGYLLPENRAYNVWVGDLHPDATDEELIEAFQTTGPVVKVRVFRDKATGKGKGWGFVHFKDRDTQTQVLKSSFEPPVVHERKVKVGPSQERNVLFIGNLHFDTTWVELLNAVIDLCGKESVAAIELKTKDDGQCRGFAFITFVDQNAAEGARRTLQDARLRLHNRDITVSWAERESDEAYNRDSKTMYLANLGDEITEEQIRVACEPYGEISKIVVAKDLNTNKAKGYAFVEYVRRLDALKAIAATHNTLIGTHYAQSSMVKPKAGARPPMGGSSYYSSPAGRGGYGAGARGGARTGSYQARGSWGAQQQPGWRGQQGGWGQQGSWASQPYTHQAWGQSYGQSTYGQQGYGQTYGQTAQAAPATYPQQTYSAPAQAYGTTPAATTYGSAAPAQAATYGQPYGAAAATTAAAPTTYGSAGYGQQTQTGQYSQQNYPGATRPQGHSARYAPY